MILSDLKVQMDSKFFKEGVSFMMVKDLAIANTVDSVFLK